MNEKRIFENNNFFNGILIISVLFCFIRVVITFIIEESVVNLFFSVIALIVLIVLFNTKWIYRIIIRESFIEYFYPINLIGKRKIEIAIDEIQSIRFDGYAHNSPSHFSLKSSKGKFRFNCPENTARKLFKFFQAKGIKVSYYDENEVGYR